MSQLNGIFDWTATYLQESEITEVHGIAQKLYPPNQSNKGDKYKSQLPESDIFTLIKKKKRYMTFFSYMFLFSYCELTFNGYSF